MAANATTVTVVLISQTFRGAAIQRPSPNRSIPAWSSIGSSADLPVVTAAKTRPPRFDTKRASSTIVAEDARQLSQTLGAADQRKLDEYLSGVRELEQRINRGRPAIDLGVAKYPRPLGIPADYQEHLRLMGDLLVLAFQCDLTRIITFVFANDGSNRSYRTVGVADGHHDLSHHGGDTAKQEKIQKINQFHIAQLAYVVQKLKVDSRGRWHPARPLHDRVRQWHQRRQRPLSRRPADPAGRQCQRNNQDWPAPSLAEGDTVVESLYVDA